MIYSKIYDFCKVKNKGTAFKNTADEVPPRVEFLMKLLEAENIDYDLEKKSITAIEHKSEKYKSKELYMYNIIMKGSSNKMVVAHHDIVNENSDNANDNSCSVINAIAIKKIMPNINVALLDGEEIGGVGSDLIDIKKYFGSIKWILNLELTGIGGNYFFMGNYPGELQNKIIKLFPEAPIINTPFNDSVVFRRRGYDSCVLTTLPPLKKENKKDSKKPFMEVKYGDVELDIDILFNCHSTRDSVSKISTTDMKNFVENVALKILS